VRVIERQPQNAQTRFARPQKAAETA